MFYLRNNTPLQNAALCMVLLSAFNTPLMLSAVNVALPAIADDLKLTAVMLSWIPMAYLTASAVCVLIFGRLADMYGRKRLFMIGIVSVIASSLFAAAAQHGAWLIAARILQGGSAAMLYATQIAIVSSVFPPQQRGSVIGLTISMVYFGLACGPLIGGYLVTAFGWRISFMLHIPLAVIVFLIAFFKAPGEWRAAYIGKFDILGALFYAATIIFLCLGIANLPDPLAISCLLISGIAGVLFFRVSRSAHDPIFDVSLLLNNRVFTFSCLASFSIYTAIFANVVLVSLFLQYIKGLSPSEAGLFMMIQPLVMALCSPYVGRLSDRKEPRLIASAGMGCTAIGLALLAMISAEHSLMYLGIALFITGFGVSLFSPPNANAIMGAVEKQYYGSATGSLATMRITGQMASMAIVTLVFNLFLGQTIIHSGNYGELMQAIQICFWLSAIICIPGFIFSFNRGYMHTQSANKDRNSA